MSDGIFLRDSNERTEGSAVWVNDRYTDYLRLEWEGELAFLNRTHANAIFRYLRDLGVLEPYGTASADEVPRTVNAVDVPETVLEGVRICANYTGRQARERDRIERYAAASVLDWLDTLAEPSDVDSSD